MEREAGPVRGMEEVVAELAALHALAIVSSTASPQIRAFLERYALAGYFAGVLGADVHTSKVEKMRMIFDRYGTQARACVFITDTLGDMREAKAHEVGTIGCSRGCHPRETLEKGIPFRIVDAPSEIPDAVDDYFARARL